jgi:large subunit ribosomal protein L18
MGRGPRYRVVFRRRREKRTDFRMRKAMIVSKAPRLVVRSSLKHVQLQVEEALPVGDKTLATASSRELGSYGWKAATGNIPAAYLTGYLLGKRAVAMGMESMILDIGLTGATKGSRMFAALRGASDAGLDVPHDDGILPSAERVGGEHIAEYAKKLLETDPEAFGKRFSQYLSSDLRPEDLPKHIVQIKEKIDETYKEGRK